MCGICGELRFDNIKINDVTSHNMLEAIASRGPDNTGQYKNRNVFLGHKRLSIIDLTNSSRQPIVDPDREFLIYNGEFYNNALHNKGIYTWADGRVYKGNWRFN